MALLQEVPTRPLVPVVQDHAQQDHVVAAGQLRIGSRRKSPSATSMTSDIPSSAALARAIAATLGRSNTVARGWGSVGRGLDLGFRTRLCGSGQGSWCWSEVVLVGDRGPGLTLAGPGLPARWPSGYFAEGAGLRHPRKITHRAHSRRHVPRAVGRARTRAAALMSTVHPRLHAHPESRLTRAQPGLPKGVPARRQADALRVLMRSSQRARRGRGQGMRRPARSRSCIAFSAFSFASGPRARA